jgi:hypothetical protein
MKSRLSKNDWLARAEAGMRVWRDRCAAVREREAAPDNGLFRMLEELGLDPRKARRARNPAG